MNHDKINKLLALAERGIDGEAVNAKAMLKKVLAKHGYTIQQYCEILLPDEQLKVYKFRWKTKYDKRLLMAVAMSLGIESYMFAAGPTKYYNLELTESKAIELEYLYEIYKTELNKEFDAYLLAFILINELGYKNTTSKNITKDKKDKKDKEDWLKRVSKHDKNIDPLQINKAIEGLNKK